MINDHSSPKGKSFNDGIPDSLLANIKLHMGSIGNIISTIFVAGRGARMSKHDLAEAYQCLAVKPEQYKLQAMKIFGSIFLATKMTYGDKQVCHR